MIGLPPHMWSFQNAAAIGNLVDDEFIEIDPECLSIKRMDVLRIKVRVVEPIKVSETITVSDK